MKVCFSFCYLLFQIVTDFIIGKATSLSLYKHAQIYLSVSCKSKTSVSDLATLALIARSTTGVLSGLGRMKGCSIWTIAQDPASRTYPKPSVLRINEKLVFESLSVDEALDQLALASASDTWKKEMENEDGKTHPVSNTWLFDCEREGEEAHGKIIHSGCG